MKRIVSLVFAVGCSLLAGTHPVELKIDLHEVEKPALFPKAPPASQSDIVAILGSGSLKKVYSSSVVGNIQEAIPWSYIKKVSFDKDCAGPSKCGTEYVDSGYTITFTPSLVQNQMIGIAMDARYASLEGFRIVNGIKKPREVPIIANRRNQGNFVVKNNEPLYLKASGSPARVLLVTPVLK